MERVVWLVAFPFYLVLAVAITVAFVAGSIVVHLRDAIRGDEPPPR